MKRIGKYSLEFKNVFIKSVATVTGPKEHKGPLGKYFDYYSDNNYFNQESWEKAEIFMQQKAIDLCLEKSGVDLSKVDVVIGGDLNNQIAITNYSLRPYNLPFLGVFSACSTFTESLLISSCLVDSNTFENVLTITSSHNSTSERQFRYPTEYGGQKPNSTTSTTTGAGSCIVSSDASSIKITKATIGVIVDANLSDAQDMGRAMAPAAFITLQNHIKDFDVSTDEYDLILTGDLSKYGNKIFEELLKETGVRRLENINDGGLLLYDIENQEVFAGGSGCGCITLVTLGYIINCLKTGVFNKVLIIATGALMNPIMLAQNETIPCIAHAVVLERSN